jgi:hydroxyacylglutathione hydrolase
VLLEVRAAAPFYKNGFVLGCETSREAVLIDPGDEVEELLDVVRHERLSVVHILLTHGHIDHMTGVGRARAVLGAPVHLHRGDLFLYETAIEQGALFGVRMEPPPPVDRFFEDGDRLTFGTYQIRIHHTPGHTPGGVCLQVGPAGKAGSQLFVGDTLFAGSIGRTDLPGGDHDTLIRSITQVLFGFCDDTEVYPGHGPKTTIGDERRTNPFVGRPD